MMTVTMPGGKKLSDQEELAQDVEMEEDEDEIDSDDEEEDDNSDEDGDSDKELQIAFEKGSLSYMRSNGELHIIQDVITVTMAKKKKQ